MALWQAPNQMTPEQIADCIALLPLDLLLEYVEDLRSQRAEQENQIQDLEEPSDAMVQRLKQLRELDKLIKTFEDRIKDRQEISTYEQENFVPENRTPMEMVRAQYKGMKLGDVAARVLNENLRLLTTTELTRLIYETKTDDELDRARNSLSSELRSGLKVQNPRWKKVGRNAYVTTFGGTK